MMGESKETRKCEACNEEFDESHFSGCDNCGAERGYCQLTCEECGEDLP